MKELTYSSLLDSTSQDEVRGAMEKAQFSPENIDSFF